MDMGSRASPSVETERRLWSPSTPVITVPRSFHDLPDTVRTRALIADANGRLFSEVWASIINGITELKGEGS